MFAFFWTVCFMLITPGPGVLTTAGLGSGYGWRVGLRVLVGLFIGTNLTAILTITGLVAIVPDTLRIGLVWASVAYFGWLAAKIAFAGAKVGFIHSERAPGIWNGITLQLINPKAYTVNTLLFGGYAFWGGGMDEILMKFLIINAIWVPVHFLWLGAGVRIRALDLGRRTQRLINVAMALALLAVVVIAAASLLGPGALESGA